MTLLSILLLIGTVETQNRDQLVGDWGRSWGRYQMGQAALTEANRELGTSYTLPALQNPKIAKKTALAYLRILDRKRPPDVDRTEWLTRCWNGGPRGYYKKSTLPYYKKIKALQK